MIYKYIKVLTIGNTIEAPKGVCGSREIWPKIIWEMGEILNQNGAGNNGKLYQFGST